MTEFAVRVQGLSKRYRIGERKGGYRTLREGVSRALTSQARLAGRLARRPAIAASLPDAIWALRDVSFDIQQGDAVGIIGRNGAGKSTLLKILSRITEPTEGRARIRGRVGSLLEVGTGFHLELTGRENVYLNGAMLGMARSEIARKFDEIVAFAEVDRFVDTPVKHYSSGMYLRLAFAVAAHLDPDILVVDEVLAVGDVQFQAKCLGKMQDVSSGRGRTVLFVSHSMDAIQRLCSTCLLLDAGRLVTSGKTTEVVAEYLSITSPHARPNEWLDLSAASRTGKGGARFTAVQYGSGNEEVGHRPYTNGPVEFRLEIHSEASRTVGSLAVTLYDRSGTKLVNAASVSQGRPIRLRAGRNRIRVRVERLHLNPGLYTVALWLADPIEIEARAGELDHVPSAFTLEVVDAESKGLGMRPKADGVVACRVEILEEG